MYELAHPVKSAMSTLKTDRHLPSQYKAAFAYALQNTAACMKVDAVRAENPSVSYERKGEGRVLELRLPFVVAAGDRHTYVFTVECAPTILQFEGRTKPGYGFDAVGWKPSFKLTFHAERNNVIYFTAQEVGSFDAVNRLKPSLGL